jgi:solute carrier family 25 (mitochondrial phosphate transporter), member 23/24/25/41
MAAAAAVVPTPADAPTPSTDFQQDAPPRDDGRRGWHTLVAGFCAGTVSRTLTAPLDRIKVLSQEGRIVAYQHALHHPTVHVIADSHTRKVSIRKVTQIIYSEGGVKGFWRGNGANCVKAGPELALVFYLRVLFMQVFEPLLESFAMGSLFANFWSGACAGAVAQCLLYPLETAKTRIAVANAGEYKGLADCLRQGYRRGGCADLYRGLTANLAGIVPYRGLEIGSFYALRTRFERTYGEAGVAATAGIGMVSSVVAQTATYPINLVRTRLQTQGVNGRPVLYHGFAHCVSSIVSQDGVAGLFRGLLANYMKAVPASVIAFVTVGQVQRLMAASTVRKPLPSTGEA